MIFETVAKMEDKLSGSSLFASNPNDMTVEKAKLATSNHLMWWMLVQGNVINVIMGIKVKIGICHFRVFET